MYLHYKSPIQIETVKKNIKKIVEKYHNPEKDGSVFRFMLKTNTCYVYKEYCDKYEDTDVYTGEFFDPEFFSEDLPDEAMQTLLQAAVPTNNSAQTTCLLMAVIDTSPTDSLSPKILIQCLTLGNYSR